MTYNGGIVAQGRVDDYPGPGGVRSNEGQCVRSAMVTRGVRNEVPTMKAVEGVQTSTTGVRYPSNEPLEPAAGRRGRVLRLGEVIGVVMCRSSLPFALLAALAITVGSESLGATLTVSPDGGSDYASVAEAVDAAASGDTVMVLPGTYSEPVYFQRDIVLLASAGPDSTVPQSVGSIQPVDAVIRGFRFEGRDFSALHFFDSESVVVENCEVCGFPLPCRLIQIQDCLVQNCYFENNHATRLGEGLGGGAIVVTATLPGLSALVEDCVFRSNSTMFGGPWGSGYCGGGAVAAEGNVEIRRCLFDSNEAITGAAVFGLAGTRLVNNTFVRNKSDDSVFTGDLGSDGGIFNCSFANNDAVAVYTTGADRCFCNAFWDNHRAIIGTCYWEPGVGVCSRSIRCFVTRTSLSTLSRTLRFDGRSKTRGSRTALSLWELRTGCAFHRRWSDGVGAS